MKIFVINLKRSKERRSIVKRKLKRVGLEFEFIEAVDGFALSRDQLNQYISPNHFYSRSFSPGEVGCFLSHYSIYKRIVEDNLPFALILEDDFELSDRLPLVLKGLEPLISQGDVISLYSSFPELCNLYKDKEINNSYSLIKPYENQLVLGAVAYIITLKVAQNMVKNLLPIKDVIDNWSFWIKKGYIQNFKIVFPHPVDLADFYSDINESFGGFALRIKKSIVNKELPILSDLILRKRKKDRWQGRMNNILINGEKPSILFY